MRFLGRSRTRACLDELADGMLSLRLTLAVMRAKLDQLLAGQTVLNQRETTMAKTLDDLLADVTAETSVLEGVKMAVGHIIAQETALKAQLDAAIAAGDLGKIQQVADALEANTTTLQQAQQTLGDAVAANTPAAPTP